MHLHKQFFEDAYECTNKRERKIVPSNEKPRVRENAGAEDP
jgi:hypothetical protein